MRRTPFKTWLSGHNISKNWEHNIHHVHVEFCETDEDPLGLRAVFIMHEHSETGTKDFCVGASYLAQRWHNLNKAGFSAPMTRKAIKMTEEKLGRSLPIFNAAQMASS